MAGEKVTAADAGKPSAPRERSKIAFPYMDLVSAIEMANAIHSHAGDNECDDDQLAVWTDQSVKSSTYRVQVYAARTFGILEGEGGKNKLSEIGRAIVDPNQLRQAKVRAFLNVPLYKAVYEKYRGTVIPPAAALERDMVTLGVSEKQKERARQVFERSAEQAGFSEGGKNRLVMPGNTGEGKKPDPSGDKRNQNNGGGGDGNDPELDPLLLAHLRLIPPPAGGWPLAKRLRWFRTFAMNVSQIYDNDDEAGELKIDTTNEKTK